MDMMERLVQWIEATRYEDLPPEVVAMVKSLTIDTLGVAIAGSTAEGVKATADLVTEWGGKQEATLLVFGAKVPAPNAALSNCTMARALDFGEVHEGGGGHLAETFVPTTLVLAECTSRPVTGKEFILAMALGAELSCRLRCALTTYRGWIAETFAPFGIVATGGRLLDFTRNELLNGMGLAYSQCSCNRQGAVGGALSVRLQQGLAARAGITAVILARRGITGARCVLEGEYGLYPLYARSEYEPARLTEGLGKEYQFAETSLKPYPSCKFTHVPISAVLEMVNVHDVKPEEIEEITVITSTKAYAGCAQGDNKYRPRNPVDAQFSIPYTVACASVRRKVFIDDFSEEAIRDERLLQIAKRVRVNVDTALDKLPGITAPNRLELKTKNGREYSRYLEFVKGHPKNPMTWEECVEKFKRCTRFSARPLSDDTVDQVVKQVADLQDAKDVRQIVRLLSERA